MKIYLMRHGEAELTGHDNARVLSAKGKESVMALADFLDAAKITVAHLFHSEKVRAIETAAIIAPHLHITHGMSLRHELDSMANIHDILNELALSEGDVFLVGHMPYMGKLASYLTTATEHLAHYAILPGSLLCFESIGYLSCWQLLWMINPQALLPSLLRQSKLYEEKN